MEINNRYTLSDQALVESVLGGNTRAFGIIIKQTEGLVTQIIFKMVDNHHDRQDLVQDIYTKAYHHLKGFRFNAKLSTWIGQIAYNTCISYLRKKGNKCFDPVFSENDAGLAIMDPAADQLMIMAETGIALSAAIDKLSPVFKTIVILYHQEELSYAEIAEITALPEGTVKSYLFRARRKLREILLPSLINEDL